MTKAVAQAAHRRARSPKLLPAAAQHPAQRHPVTRFGEARRDQLLLGGVERALGVEQANGATALSVDLRRWPVYRNERHRHTR
ncbi:hypothetical protein [Aromatoleum bremense]|uniref:Uncharacterized protein n=1 Tax=Aromatoleum bremense TaxID=76115 RepID=A0ABX1NXZ1_9RHOO|nr:hypothetical protein [Aromatoleum bremense]NMG16718.1 hypothetical protein [Aromatoleum bremense]QTQ31688.1 Uncharacterized protein pbN1_16970 [Aromatoleum bremense]